MSNKTHHTVQVGCNSQRVYVLCEGCKALKLLRNFDHSSGGVARKCKSCEPRIEKPAKAPKVEQVLGVTGSHDLAAMIERELEKRGVKSRAVARPAPVGPNLREAMKRTAKARSNKVGASGQRVTPRGYKQIGGERWCPDCKDFRPASMFGPGMNRAYCEPHRKERQRIYSRRHDQKRRQRRLTGKGQGA